MATTALPVGKSLSARTRPRAATVARAQDDDKPQTRGGDDEPDRDEDGLYIGTYSNFFTDPDQLKGVVIFCAFLASFLSLGNIGAAILLRSCTINPSARASRASSSDTTVRDRTGPSERRGVWPEC